MWYDYQAFFHTMSSERVFVEFTDKRGNDLENFHEQLPDYNAWFKSHPK